MIVQNWIIQILFQKWVLINPDPWITFFNRVVKKRLFPLPNAVRSAFYAMNKRSRHILNAALECLSDWKAFSSATMQRWSCDRRVVQSSSRFNDVLNLRCGFYCVQGSQQVFNARYGQDARHRCNAQSELDNKYTVHRWLVQYNFDNIRTPVIIGHTAVKYGAEGHLIRLCVHIIFVMSVYFHDL